jgi:hypothetical protein
MRILWVSALVVILFALAVGLFGNTPIALVLIVSTLGIAHSIQKISEAD